MRKNRETIMMKANTLSTPADTFDASENISVVLNGFTEIDSQKK
jgi:hypothetical protein